MTEHYISAPDARAELAQGGRKISRQRFHQMLLNGYVDLATGQLMLIDYVQMGKFIYIASEEWEKHRNILLTGRLTGRNKAMKIQNPCKASIYVGEKIRELREELGLSQVQFAALTGISQGSMSLIESGNRQINICELFYIAEVFNRDPSWFLPEFEPLPQGSKVTELLEQQRQINAEQERIQNELNSILRNGHGK